MVHPLTGQPPTPEVRWNVRTGGATGRIGRYGYTRMGTDGRFRKHEGVDWICPDGQPVYAAHDGYVHRTGFEVNTMGQEVNLGYGHRVYLRRGASVMTIYAHLVGSVYPHEVFVPEGALIGWAGRTGSPSYDTAIPTHLHFEALLEVLGSTPAKQSKVNPEHWLHGHGSADGVTLEDAKHGN